MNWAARIYVEGAKRDPGRSLLAASLVHDGSGSGHVDRLETDKDRWDGPGTQTIRSGLGSS